MPEKGQYIHILPIYGKEIERIYAVSNSKNFNYKT